MDMKVDRPKNKRAHKLKEKLSEVAFALQEMAEEMAWAFANQNYIPLPLHNEMRRRRQSWEEKKWAGELKRRKWIEIKMIGDRLCTRLTSQGWQRALRDRIRTETQTCENGICIVTFDVPEKERRIRKILRLFLKECGFKKLQHSVWMTDKNITEPLMLLLQRKGLDKWIKIIQGNIITAGPLDGLRALRAKR